MENYFVFGQTILKGYWETVFLNKKNKFTRSKKNLMLFKSKNEAENHIKENKWDLAEIDTTNNL